jgi:hypothetical protein
VIESPVEWLASLLSSPLVEFGEKKGRTCQECGQSILVGGVRAKFCARCAEARQRASQQTSRLRPKRDEPRTCRDCEVLVSVKALRCTEHAKLHSAQLRKDAPSRRPEYRRGRPRFNYRKAKTHACPDCGTPIYAQSAYCRKHTFVHRQQHRAAA